MREEGESAREARLEALLGEMARVEGERDVAAGASAKVEKVRLDALQGELKRVEGERGALRGELENMEGGLAERDTLAQASEEAARLQEERESAREARLEALLGEMARVKGERDGAAGASVEVEKVKLEALQGEVERVEGEREALRGELERMEGKLAGRVALARESEEARWREEVVPSLFCAHYFSQLFTLSHCCPPLFFCQNPLFFFFTLVTGPRRSLSLQLSDARVFAS